jgi:hypothetical protein
MTRDQLLTSAKALLELDAKGVLVPHGIGGHARDIIQGFLDLAAAPHPTSGETEPVGWRCAKCGCLTFARVDELNQSGHYSPGNDVRCVSCKDVSFFPAVSPSPVPAVREASNTIARFNSIIEAIEARCMATDGPVTPTLKEMTEQELTDIWACLQFIRTALQSQPDTGRAAVLEAAAKVADASQGLHVTGDLVHGITPGSPEREFWRGFAAAKQEIASSIRALAVPSHNGGE